MKRILVTALAASTALAAPALADDAALREQAREMFEAIPLQPPMLEDNVISRDRVDLGKALFFDPRMSRSGLFSCQSCHNVGIGGVDGLETSIGHGWQKGPRNAPTMLNAVFNVAQFWDGRAPDLEAQAKGPVQAGVEMNNTPDNLVATLKSMPAYVASFQTSFPGEDDPVTFDNFAKAIEAFEATLITPNSPFDKFLMGQDAALSDQQKRGLALFMDEGCAACHQGINVGGQDYYPFGVVEKPGADVLPEGDHGRFAVTETADDQYVFRAGPLRNIALTAPYFHSGTVWELRDAVAIMATSQLGSELDDAQIDDITAFLEALTGEQPQVVHPILPPRTKDTPKPYTMLTEQK
ncbi:cytochrome C peroxidase [Thioclava marina]|jgi:Cytochrome c peroxidase|uniref:Cytochrome C peroxidase n=1 Tax=Thioclava marina TaxID=1915077 RepID=A0ABX3MN34_9RHOB|nr:MULTISPECIES: cytochrome-c peroxidase [Thioclava]MBD3804255.1 cytochrome-c peroxidase [Thioclava sp.]OOY12660.1 cytochrome C peroxidase [Thioclava marina]OOY26574.1 cytochrome C peroxidase [Thioclava sp. L04-15]TNE89677.1 MAG: cytochrome-c peroxidase [Paracoccaceae bacterium]